MAGNFTQPGDTLELVAPTGGVVSGGVYKIGDVVGVATGDAAQATAFRMRIVGVFKVVKAAGQVWSANPTKIYWDDTAKNFTTTVGSNTLVGVTVFSAISGATVGYVRLDGVAR